jgi:hypothetical protein
MRTRKGVMTRRARESSKLAASDVNAGTPLAAASRICGIPRRTFRDWVSRKGSLLKKLGRNTVLPADAEKQLHQRIVCLQQVDSQVCCSYIQGTRCAEWWEKVCLLSDKEPMLNSEESRKSPLWPTNDI